MKNEIGLQISKKNQLKNNAKKDCAIKNTNKKQQTYSQNIAQNVYKIK